MHEAQTLTLCIHTLAYPLSVMSKWLALLLLMLVVASPPAAGTRKSLNVDPDAAWWLGVGSASNWASVATIPYLTGPAFRVATDFLLQMCSNAYTYEFTDPDPDDLPILIGWHLSTDVPPLASPRKGAAGLRAFVYAEDAKPLDTDTTRTVIVFRGWDVSSTSRDELADLCASALLFPGYVDFLFPPSHLCSSYFHASDLDYLSQAIAYTRIVLSYYPSSSVLLAGHSFGAGIAVLVSAALQNETCPTSTSPERHMVKDDLCVTLPVVSFSGPGPNEYLNKKKWTLSNSPYIITISHNWDYFSVHAQWSNHYGWLCVWDAPEPTSCQSCFTNRLRASSLEALKSRSLSGSKTQNDNTGNKDDSNGNDANDNNNNDDDCQCHYDDEPCWDCLTDSHTTDSLQTAAANASLTPTCKFYSVYQRVL